MYSVPTYIYFRLITHFKIQNSFSSRTVAGKVSHKHPLIELLSVIRLTQHKLLYTWGDNVNNNTMTMDSKAPLSWAKIMALL